MFFNRPAAARYRPLTVKAGGLALAGWLCLSIVIQGAETNRPPAEVAIPKSTFVWEGDIGKNPFYPHSTRLKPKRSDDSTQTTTQDFSQLLVLKGITGPLESRIALINNLTFTKGEEGEVRAGNGKVKIRVLEIRDKSVVVSIAGAAPKELFLLETLLPIPK